MRRYSILILSTALVFCLPGLLLSNDGKQGVPLPGEYVGPGQPTNSRPSEIGLKQGPKESSRPTLRFQDLPVIEESLAQKAAQLNPAEPIRVIIFLDYLPHDQIARQMKAKYARKFKQIGSQAKAMNAKYAQKRNLKARTDAENYREEILTFSNEDAQTMRTIAENHEALSLTIKNKIAASLSAEITSYQQSLKNAIEALGGTVEFGTIAGNALVALVPAGILDEIGNLDKVDHVVEDRLMEAHLDIADDATKVGWSSPGLWLNGYTGRTYDPAVLDTGTDINHPALVDNTAPLRDNFHTYYLETAKTQSNFDDDANTSDDLSGHGTHVMGIVASYGPTPYQNYLGMSYDVDKTVTLKAGYKKTTGGSSMFWSDAMNIVDTALYDSNSLEPLNTFNDDVDGINMSFGGATSSDETSYSRFWDSVISSYPDIVVTFSAGNSGPSNTVFQSPACAYNSIAVANVNDKNTTSRNDDTIASGSTRGPTANGRRKPDIAAPGTNIMSCNNDWETGNDFVNMSGTSMAAPMVLGVAMDLMDAGVTDELEIKALLINTAQKNEPNVNFESDSDGWSTAYGWGYMNALAAYYHRNDVRTASVTENGQPGDYRLYKGQMQDEGSIPSEGRDRATIVWNRHATYNPAAYPTTYYNLSNLNLYLFREADNNLIDSDYNSKDNVHQVRIGAGASPTDVVVRVYAGDTNFPHGGATETYALATEESFVEVNLPSDFQGMSSYPSQMEPNEEADFEFWLINNSSIASHNNEFDLILPAGWTKVSGPDPYSAGSIAGGGGTSSHVTWRLKAQSTEQDGVVVKSRHNHSSYFQLGVDFDWNMTVDVRWPVCGDVSHPYPTGDLDEDCTVDGADLDIFAERWLDTGCSDPNRCSGADLDDSNDVDFFDFGVFSGNWRDCTDPNLPCGYNP